MGRRSHRGQDEGVPVGEAGPRRPGGIRGVDAGWPLAAFAVRADEGRSGRTESQVGRPTERTRMVSRGRNLRIFGCFTSKWGIHLGISYMSRRLPSGPQPFVQKCDTSGV